MNKGTFLEVDSQPEACLFLQSHLVLLLKDNFYLFLNFTYICGNLCLL